MAHRSSTKFNAYEILFSIYTAGWILDEFAAIIEHGWEIHAQNLWSFLDITFTIIYIAYVIVRICDLVVARPDGGHGLHILSIAAPVLLPRISFNLLPDNIVFISLHTMMKDFTLLTLLAVWCFMGFFLAMRWLIEKKNKNSDAADWVTICKWMLWIWFGLDGTGIERSVDFHVILGPFLMIAFAFLGNTLFLTILVAMLTNTFSKIVANDTAEIQFRRTVLTFEGVKSDSIFAYPPPFNILALLILLPLKLVLSPRWFHKVNVAAIRVLNAPTLFLISIYERQRLWQPPNQTRHRSFLSWTFSGFSPHGDIQAVFRAIPPQKVREMIEQLDGEDVLGNQFVTNRTKETSTHLVCVGGGVSCSRD